MNGQNPQRILFVHDSHTYGGMERHMLLLMRHLDRSRYTPLVCVPGYTEPYWASPELFVEETRALDIPVIRPPHPGKLRVAHHLADVCNLAQLFRQEQLDAVHIHTNRPVCARKSVLAARMAGVPVVVRSEHLPPTHFGLGALTPFVAKPFDALTDALIVGSDACLDEQIGPMRRDPRKVHCLPYGIDLERFNPRHDLRAAKARLGFDPDLPLVGAIGRLSELKGHTYFIEAAARVVAAGRRAQFVIVGDGPLRAQLQAQVKQAGLCSCFHFAGFQPDTVPFMQAIDIAVMPTAINEGISLAMLEFMAMGKPLVATDDPSFEETIVNEVTGLAVPKRDGPALAAALLRLLAKPAFGQALAERALADVHRRFSIQRQAQALMGLYDDLLISATTRSLANSGAALANLPMIAHAVAPLLVL